MRSFPDYKDELIAFLNAFGWDCDDIFEVGRPQKTVTKTFEESIMWSVPITYWTSFGNSHSIVVDTFPGDSLADILGLT